MLFDLQDTTRNPELPGKFKRLSPANFAFQARRKPLNPARSSPLPAIPTFDGQIARNPITSEALSACHIIDNSLSAPPRLCTLTAIRDR